MAKTKSTPTKTKKPSRAKADETAPNGKAPKNGAGRATIDQLVIGACDILRRSNCAGALQYVPELTWMLFLRILDEREEREASEAAAVGDSFRPSIAKPFRWRDWAAPFDRDTVKEWIENGRKGQPPQGWKRYELTEAQTGAFFGFVNGELLPYLTKLRDTIDANVRQKVISEIMSGVERTRVDTERNLLDVLDRVHRISQETTDTTHVFTLSQVYEGLLLKMGEKGNDGGQFFTPREVIRAVVKTVAPRVGERVYDPCCGTGGFLAQAYEQMRAALGPDAKASDLQKLRQDTFFGREKENLVYPIALANLILHGIDRPQIWHGNTLTGGEVYGGLFSKAPPNFEVIVTNPPFGGKEGKDAQTQFAFKTSATQILFLQHVLKSLAKNGRCGIVVDEGVLFRTNEKAFVETKRKLLSECDLWCIVSLPPGVFSAAGAGVKTDLLFFTKGAPTKSVWYYDLSGRKVTKKSPMTMADFDDFFAKLPGREDSDLSWSVSIEAIKAKNYDLKAVNPNAKSTHDTRTPSELIDEIEAQGEIVREAMEQLRGLLKG